MSTLATLRGLRPSLAIPQPPHASSSSIFTITRSLSTSPPLAARKASGGGGQQTPEHVTRMRNLKQHLFGRAPPPLRMARNRHLRHWTIHRAWLLLQRQQREARERELYRMHQSMWNANEELRNTSGPGTRDEGWLYRVAQEKKGVYGPEAVPIEYARYQTETPARQAWNHDWKP
ncbi:hypothetical protein CMUS01_08644 [Colletotrichum musicola]|uniref:Ring finger domain-containing protein n=1 Tax=Colletotrichum musicola TaxID=2175873 RepID=A0A8H6KB93_9PEZI|nr:hypothetical protein CMUS01_08644 [Colletotrichum musicola]